MRVVRWMWEAWTQRANTYAYKNASRSTLATEVVMGSNVRTHTADPRISADFLLRGPYFSYIIHINAQTHTISSALCKKPEVKPQNHPIV